MIPDAAIILVVLILVFAALFVMRNEEKKQLDQKERENAPGSFMKLRGGFTQYELAGDFATRLRLDRIY